jgi:hypothetical protein
MLDTNLWSYLGDDASVRDLDRLLDDRDLRVVVAPSTLLEVFDIPHEDVRNRIIRGMATGPRRSRLHTEAESYATEVVNLVRLYRPEWMLQVPNPALAARHQNFWLKKVWSEALENSARHHRYQQDQKPTHDHIMGRQRFQRTQMLETKFELPDLTAMIATADDPALGQLAGWDGSATALWRLQLGQLSWYQLGVIGPRARMTGEDRTMTDWVEPYVDLRKLRRDPDGFAAIWLDQARIEDVPRNWLSWAVEVVQWTQKIGSGNPADAQHAAYLLDCDVFLSADKRYVAALERVRSDAPFKFATTRLVSADRSTSVASRIAAALE